MRFLAGILSVIMALTPLQGVKASETDSDGNTVQQSLKLNEVNSSPDDWVEIINTGAEELDISGYELRDNSDDHRWKFADNTTVSANGLLLVDAKIGGAMALDYDTYEHVLWVAADNGYNNLAAKKAEWDTGAGDCSCFTSGRIRCDSKQ